MDYSHYVKEFESLYLSAAMGTSAPLKKFPLVTPAPTVLILAPHPDDECLMGGYALRMKQESGAKVFVAPYSLGSKVERQAIRDEELNRAIKKLGFERVAGVAANAEAILNLLNELKPDYLFSPHSHDGHGTHIKTNHDCGEALLKYLSLAAAGTRISWLQTEFWQSLPSPNLLVSLNADYVEKLGLALLEHKGEIIRNPYHLRLPGWYMDQVRRGSERVLGAGKPGIDTVFGQLYFQVDCEGADIEKWIVVPPSVL